MGEATDIGDIQHKALGQLALDGKVKGVGVRGLDFVVQAPGNRKAARVQ
jgi:hypothetical protein